MPFDPTQHRFHNVIARAFGARGHMAGQSVLDDVMPVYEVNDKDDPSMLWSREEHLVHGYFSQAAVAAQYGHIYFDNVPGELLLITTLRMRVGTLGPVYAGSLAASYNPATLTGAWGDTRRTAASAGTGPGGVSVQGTTIAANPNLSMAPIHFLVANTWTDLQVPWVVCGRELDLALGAVNAQVEVMWSGIRRVIDEQELR